MHFLAYGVWVESPAEMILSTFSGRQAPVQGHSGAQQQRASLYIKNLPPGADKLYLYERFARFGAVLSVKVNSCCRSGH